MPIPALNESNSSGVSVVKLGATAAEGGTRDKVLEVGGARTLPYMAGDGELGNKPIIAIDVLDCEPADWPAPLVDAYSDVIGKPGAWAKKAVDECGADMICIKLDGIDPDGANRSADEAVAAVTEVRDAVSVPLIVWGCGNPAKDNAVMPKVSQALKGERCLLGVVTEDDYKTLAAVSLADGHAVIGLAPVDINIAKQVNVLLSDMEFPLDRIVMFQTTGALGYGIEYAYSIQERERLAALGGDKMMSLPVICDCGREAWRAKEAKSTDAEAPEWGPQAMRGVAWEASTAALLLQAGADIFRMRHPDAVAVIKKQIDALYG